MNRLIYIRGIVQGVGFRPTVYRLALKHGIKGWVLNAADGVHIEAHGLELQLDAFVDELRANPPQLAIIDEYSVTEQPEKLFDTFSILQSEDDPADFLPVSPDLAICPDCKRELFDQTDRRFRYPFINCTHCGPRFSIVRTIPYDRPNTSMAGFALCENCRKEYENPLDRRFHAQPIACDVCGPHMWLNENRQTTSEREAALQNARYLLKQGKILAVKGLGGFHLVCDASNPIAVERLRERKHRTGKPLAVMTFDFILAQKFAQFSAQEHDWLLSPQSPIVLAEPTETGKTIMSIVAPDQKRLGIMIAYTPLHLLLLEPEPGYPEIFVMTSGNLSEEPIASGNEEAEIRLGSIADAILMHDRPILTRMDDSVITTLENQPYYYRRARGIAPSPILLPFLTQPILATGSQLKNAFCLTRENYAFVSQHMGDLDNQETLAAYEETIIHNQGIFRIQPQLLACDLHPDYLSTRYAEARAVKENLPLVKVQHHHAHLAACLAENGWNTDEPVIGLIFDGTGYGPDGTIWGGEVLVGGYRSYERRFYLSPVPLPGGDLAAQTPARMAVSHLLDAGYDLDRIKLPPLDYLGERTFKAITNQCQTGFNAPLTSSMGRLFDAVASIIGVKHVNTYEAEAAIRLETIADETVQMAYPFLLDDNQIVTESIIDAVVQDYLSGKPQAIIAGRFHYTIAKIASVVCRIIREERNINTVAISGGVWQNLLLMKILLLLLHREGFTPLIHRRLPPNDGCVALGQAAITQRAMKE
ncbi:MAG: carbamoyltransferase HypF [Anaerolineaceae bacterium]